MNWEEINVFDDVLRNNLMLPKKEKYNVTDAKKLIKLGAPADVARFIVICSAAYYKTSMSKIFCKSPTDFEVALMFC